MNKKAINFTTVIKGMFLAVLIGICAYSVKDTFCDVWVLSTNDDYFNEQAYVWIDGVNDSHFRDFDQNSNSITIEAYSDTRGFVSISTIGTDITDSEQLTQYLFDWVDKIYVSDKIASRETPENEKAERIKSLITASTIHVINCNITTTDLSETWIPQKEIATFGGVATDWQNQDGYKEVEKMASLKDMNSYWDTLQYKDVFKNDINNLDACVTAMMKDFRSYALALQTSDGMKSDYDIKQRITEFSAQCGFSKEMCLGLIDYALTHDTPITERIKTLNISGYADAENYFNGKAPAIYDAEKHGIFYYFIKTFYDYDKNAKKTGSLSVNDLESYYVAVVGNINVKQGETASSSMLFGLGGAFLKVISSATDELAESVTKTLAHDICWGIIEILEKSEEAIVDFSPSLEKYLEYFGGVGAGAKESDVKELFDINNLFYYIGAFLLVLLTLIQLVTIIVNPDEAKTDIPHLIARFIILAIFIYWGRNIIGYVFDLTNKIWNWCVNNTGFANRNDDRKIFYKAIKLVTYDYFGINWTYSVVGVIFNCAIGFIIIKNIFMVLAECIERYIVAVLLYFTFPTALSFGVSNTTSNILNSYFRMLGTQLFMLFMNLYFVRGFVVLLDNLNVWADSFYGLIFVIAYLKVAQAFDSYLSSLGLSVAHTSGRMASELLGVGSTLLAGTMMLGRIGMSVGRGLLNTGARGVGSALSTGAIMSGSQGNGALKAFNMGENLRAQGLRGLLGGARLNANTLTNLNSAQTGRFGLTQASTFKNAMAGGINGGMLNANKQTSGKALLDALGTGLTANGRISDAKFNSLGGGLAINGSVKTAGGKTIATSGQLSLTDSQLKAGHGMSAPRTFGVAMSGDVMRGSFAYNTNVASGDSFKLNKDSIQKIGGEYVVTDAELGLGANFLANEAVRTHTLDLASQGHDITLTKQANGNIMVSDGSDIIGYTSEHGDRWFTDSKERAITTDDFNGGALTYLRPNENCEAINIITMDEVKDGTLLNPTSMDFLKDHNFGEDATIVLFKDKETDELYAKEVHPTMESESENIRGDYTVVNLDTKSYNEDDGSTVIKGDEDQIYDRDYRKVGNNRHPKNP